MGEYQKDGNFRRKFESGKSGRNEIIGIIGGKLWPERVVGYEKDGNYRRGSYGRKEW